MKGIENQELVLVLNANWQPIGKKTVKDAIVSLCSGAVDALDIEYEQDEFGQPDFTRTTLMKPVSWEEWFKISPKEWHLSINTAHRKIRVPTVIIASGYSKMPKKSPSLSRNNVCDAYGWICAYSGKKLTKSTATLDHIIPKSKGGKNSWENIVPADKEINNKKGNRFNHEIGLKLLRQPIAPNPVPAWAFIKEAKHHDWSHFLIK